VAIELLCRKIGMTQIFEESGIAVPVTVLDVTPNTVVQKKTQENDGYSAIQLGFGEKRLERTSKGLKGHFEKAGVAPKQHLTESRISAEEVEGYELGQAIKVDVFEKGQHVDVIGTSKGRGTSGVIKRHNFKITRRTHGTHEAFRHGGSIGAGSYPGRVFKGTKMAGRMGNERVTALNLQVALVDAEKGLLYVRGSVPGHPNAILRVRKTGRGGADQS
jgi:large subunit ribosomal protein L3